MSTIIEDLLAKLRTAGQRLPVIPPDMLTLQDKIDDEIARMRQQTTGNLEQDRASYESIATVSQEMELEGIRWPKIAAFVDGQIDSSSTGDTVLLTGATNKMYIVCAVTSFKVVGTTQAWRYEIDSGSAFGDTRRISPTSTNDKETQGQHYCLLSTERLVINVTTAVGSSTIDWTVHYWDMGFGTVWSTS